eukprot:tig00000480_g1298.t1
MLPAALAPAAAAYLSLASAVALLTMGYDKVCAKRRAFRVSELRIVLLTLAGGYVGTLFGMVFFAHKIRKLKFWLSIGAAAYAWSRLLPAELDIARGVVAGLLSILRFPSLLALAVGVWFLTMLGVHLGFTFIIFPSLSIPFIAWWAYR